MGAPTISSLVLTCSILVMPDVCQELITFGVEVVLPIQRNLRVSNSMPWTPIACDAIMLVMIA